MCHGFATLKTTRKRKPGASERATAKRSKRQCTNVAHYETKWTRRDAEIREWTAFGVFLLVWLFYIMRTSNEYHHVSFSNWSGARYFSPSRSLLFFFSESLYFSHKIHLMRKIPSWFFFAVPVATRPNASQMWHIHNRSNRCFSHPHMHRSCECMHLQTFHLLLPSICVLKAPLSNTPSTEMIMKRGAEKTSE